MDANERLEKSEKTAEKSNQLLEISEKVGSLFSQMDEQIRRVRSLNDDGSLGRAIEAKLNEQQIVFNGFKRELRGLLALIEDNISKKVDQSSTDVKKVIKSLKYSSKSSEN